MIYEAQIVEKPNADLATWIRALVVVHGTFSLYTAYSYKIHHATDIRWMTLAFTWFFLGVMVPLMGLRASEKLDKKRLALFSGIQGFVGFFNLINFLSFASVLSTVMNWCSSDECQEMFVTRNHSCLVSLSNETYEMAESYCDDTPYNVGTALFFLLLSWVSCMGATAARQMHEVKVVSVVSVSRTAVPCRTVPVIPGDVIPEAAIPEDLEYSSPVDEYELSPEVDVDVEDV
jgi:hypothetical protein